MPTMNRGKPYGALDVVFAVSMTAVYVAVAAFVIFKFAVFLTNL